MAYVIIIIALPLVEREIENVLLRERFKSKSLEKLDIIKIILPIELIFTAVTGLISLLAGLRVFIVVFIGMVIGMGFNFFRQYEFANKRAGFLFAGIIPKSVKKIRSAKLYDGMVITSGVAFNIFAFTYMLFIMYSGIHKFFFDFFIVFGGLSLIFTATYLSTFKIVNSPLIQKIGKNAAFVLGTAISIFAVYVFRDSWFHGALAISIQTVLLLAGLVLQMTATLGLKEDVLLVFKLYDPKTDDKALSERAARLEVLTVVISEAVFLAVLLILISNPVFYLMNVSDYIIYAPYIGSSVMVIPTMFLFISLVYSIKQPLTKKFGQKLKTYVDMTNRGKHNPDMEKRLYNVLIKKYKKRIGVYIIRAFLKSVMYHAITGKEHVDDLPGIFVFNHGEFYGPVAAVVFLPYAIRPWILHKMIDKNEITRHIYDGTFSKIKGLPEFIKKLIARTISPIIVWALRSFDPIPVYRGTARTVIKTFLLSIECLNAGDSILLFPENPDEEYEEKISPFYTGFANLGRMYYKKTGESVTFYPVYASKRNRILSIGKGVKFNPDNGRKERDRIVITLEQRMRDMQTKDDI
ncbi:MAG: lysophospholipid acyltransferase family protein [Christensenellales bacterium]